MKENDIRPKDVFDRLLELCRRDIDIYFSDRGSFIDVGCPACRSADVSYSFTKDSFTFLECTRCKTLYVSPRPSQEMIDNFYRDSASCLYLAGVFYKKTEANRREKLFKPKAKTIVRLAKKHHMPTKTIVDIGAGYGTFCEELQNSDVFNQVYALEPSAHLAQVCCSKGIKVIESSVEKLDQSNQGKFDIAVSLELLEHVFSVELFLDAVSKLLRPKRFFVFSTLNSRGWDIINLGKRSKSICPPFHLNFLNPESVGLLVERTGWRLIDVFTPGKLDVDIVVNFAEEFPEVEHTEFTRQIINSDEATRQAFQEFLSDHRMSSHMWAVLQKQ